MLKTITLFLILFSSPIFSAEERRSVLVEGVDYKKLEQPQTNLSKTQVFFWFGCESCFKLLPLIEKQFPHWEITPISIYKPWRQQTKLYFTLRSLNLPLSLDQNLMTNIHNGKISADDFYSQKKFIINSGVDVETFDRAFYSEAINQLATATDSLKQGIKISKVPSALIGGKYYTDLTSSKTLELFMDNIVHLEQLVELQKQQQNAEADH